MITPSLPAGFGLKYGGFGGSLFSGTSGSFLVSAEATAEVYGARLDSCPGFVGALEEFIRLPLEEDRRNKRSEFDWLVRSARKIQQAVGPTSSLHREHRHPEFWIVHQRSRVQRRGVRFQPEQTLVARGLNIRDQLHQLLEAGFCTAQLRRRDGIPCREPLFEIAVVRLGAVGTHLPYEARRDQFG